MGFFRDIVGLGLESLGFFVVLIIILSAVVHRWYIRADRGDDKSMPLTVGLANKGWVLYSKPGCGACDAQKRLLGEPYLSTIECEGAKCSGVTRRFPFWLNTTTDESRVGLQSLGSLAAMAYT